MRALVILPTYLEAANIATVLGQVRSHAAADVLVVDDNSPDGTGDIAEAVAAELGGIHVLRRPAPSGLGSAYREGFSWGLTRGYDALVEMDADLSHDPAALPTLIGELERGADAVIGSRYVPGGAIPAWGPVRRALSLYGNRYAALALRLGVSDATSGFRAYSAPTLAAMDLGHIRANGYCFQIEMTYRLVRSGRRVVEVPITFRERAAGDSKMSPRIVVEAVALVTGWGLRDRLRRRLPSRAAAGQGT